jgi:NAD(P)-dependent dehydrogenase (short-subunit alcohol dehydrogenase family)
MSLFDLTGKVAIVTGSSRGIGRSIALNMAAHGAKVVVSSRKLDACQTVVDEITKAGGTATAIAANISDKAGLQRLVDETRKAFGPIDVLVCNAASNPYFGPAMGMGDEVFEKIMRNNVLSNHWLCTMVHDEMAARKDGAIIIVSARSAPGSRRSRHECLVGRCGRRGDRSGSGHGRRTRPWTPGCRCDGGGDRCARRRRCGTGGRTR